MWDARTDRFCIDGQWVTRQELDNAREEESPKILPFIPIDQRNHQLDQAIAEREQSDDVLKMAEAALFALEVERIANGEIG